MVFLTLVCVTNIVDEIGSYVDVKFMGNWC